MADGDYAAPVLESIDTTAPAPGRGSKERENAMVRRTPEDLARLAISLVAMVILAGLAAAAIAGSAEDRERERMQRQLNIGGFTLTVNSAH